MRIVVDPSASDAQQSGPIGLILRTGLIAGTLDITDNLIFNEFRGITPTMVFHYIASGLFGIDKALQRGTTSVVVGVALHYTIALIWTAIFYVRARFVILTNRPVISGLLYGVVVYLVEPDRTPLVGCSQSD